MFGCPNFLSSVDNPNLFSIDRGGGVPRKKETREKWEIAASHRLVPPPVANVPPSCPPFILSPAYFPSQARLYHEPLSKLSKLSANYPRRANRVELNFIRNSTRRSISKIVAISDGESAGPSYPSLG